MKNLLLFLVFIAFVVVSCEKETDTDPVYNSVNLPSFYKFEKSEFVGNIICQDQFGKLIDTVPTISRYSFLFYDGDIYPYETIEFLKDSMVQYSWIRKEQVNTENGYFSEYKDTLYFFENKSNAVVFKGFIKDNSLYIPAYGYSAQATNSNYFGYSGTYFGNPDLSKIFSVYYQFSYDRIFIQRFNLKYVISSK